MDKFTKKKLKNLANKYWASIDIEGDSIIVMDYSNFDKFKKQKKETASQFYLRVARALGWED